MIPFMVRWLGVDGRFVGVRVIEYVDKQFTFKRKGRLQEISLRILPATLQITNDLSSRLL